MRRRGITEFQIEARPAFFRAPSGVIDEDRFTGSAGALEIQFKISRGICAALEPGSPLAETLNPFRELFFPALRRFVSLRKVRWGRTFGGGRCRLPRRQGCFRRW